MDVGYAVVRIYGDLADLAEAADRDGQVDVPIGNPRSVKDAVESCGVPHTEVDLLVVDGESVGWAHRISAGARIAAYPAFAELDVPSLVRPPPRAPRFLLDVHLGRLAQRLRVLGLDAAYDNDAEDADLAARASREERWLLTRDRGLLMRASVTHGALVRHADPVEQAAEIVLRFGLADSLVPFTRCARCGGELAPVDKAAVVDRLPPATRLEHDRFVACAGCEQVYWEGSHTASLQAFVTHVRRVGRRPER